MNNITSDTPSEVAVEAPKHWVWIDGGLAQDSSAEVVIMDTDVLRDHAPDETSWESVADIFANATAIGLTGVAKDCKDWMEEHAHLDPTVEPQA